MKIVEKIKDEAKYYWKDFWQATLGSAFKYEVMVGKNSTESFWKEKDKKVSPKQRSLNNAFYATIGQLIASFIFWPSSVQVEPLFIILFVVDSFIYVFLGFLVSKNHRRAGAALLVWFCIDKLLLGLIRLFTNFTLSGVFYFILFNYFFGQFYYKAFRYLRENKDEIN